MAKNLYTPNVDRSTVDNLISGTLIPCKVIPAQLELGTEVVPRGTLLTSSDGETYAPYTGTDEIHGVLLLDVDATDADECLGAPVAFCGEFNQNVIEEVGGLQLTPLAIAKARARQIYIAPMELAPEAFTTD